MPRDSRAEFLVTGKKLSAAYLANAADLPGLDATHKEFVSLLTELEALGIQQAAQTATVQQTTKEIEERLTRGRLLAARLRNGVKLHLGTRTEKVIEYGIKPFRKPVRAPKVIEKIVEVPAKSETDTATPKPPTT